MIPIKSYREKELPMLALSLSLLLVFFCAPYESILSNSSVTQFENILGLLPIGIVTSFLSLSVFVIDSLFTSSTKDKFIWFLSNNKPGNTVFSKIENKKFKDVRVDNNLLIEYYSEKIKLCNNHSNPNSIWYNIYIKHESNPKIQQAQKDFLLSRDLNCFSIVFLFLYILSLVFLGHMINFSFSFVFICLLFIIVTNISTRVKASTFVNTVIVTDYYKKRGESK